MSGLERGAWHGITSARSTRRGQQVFGLGFARTGCLPRSWPRRRSGRRGLRPSGVSTPPVPLTAARQFRIRTGFPDHVRGSTGPGSLPRLPPHPSVPGGEATGGRGRPPFSGLRGRAALTRPGGVGSDEGEGLRHPTAVRRTPGEYRFGQPLAHVPTSWPAPSAHAERSAVMGPRNEPRGPPVGTRKPPSATEEIPKVHRQYLLRGKTEIECPLTCAFAVLLWSTVAVVVSQDFGTLRWFPRACFV